MHPLLVEELGDDFRLGRVMAHGTLPGIYSEQDPEVRNEDLRSYTDAYLKEEVQAEALVQNIGGYARLLELFAASSGQILNIQSLSKEAAVNYETTRRYISVLEDTLVAFRIPSWRGTSRAQLIAHPKMFFFDVGVRNAILRRPLDQSLPDEKGILFEHIVAYEMYRRQGTLRPEYKTFFYRTKHGGEIDFILEIGTERWAIEVKASRNISKTAIHKLNKHSENISNLKRKIIVFLGSEPQHIEGVEILPFKKFCSIL